MRKLLLVLILAISCQAKVTVGAKKARITSASTATFTELVSSTFTVTTGGTRPITITESGSLPTGVAFTDLGNGTAIIAGTPASGTAASSPYALTLVATNQYGSSSQIFSLVINAAAVAPTYSSACTDTTTIQLPSPLPAFGNLTGANTLISDPEPSNGTTCFHLPIVRVTDANTDPSALNSGYGVSTGGSGDKNIWNTDSTLFLAGSNYHYPWAFNPATMQVSRLYVSNFPATGGMKFVPGGSWAYTNSQLLYVLNGTMGQILIQSYDFTDRSTPPSPVTVFNFASGGNCLPTSYYMQWNAPGFNSKDDNTFAAAFSNTGYQGTGVDIVVWRRGSGCIHLNTQTGVITADFGATGTINIPDRFTLHNVKISKDGNWLVIVKTLSSCFTTCTGSGVYLWNIGTLNVNIVSTSGQGHWTEGYTHWLNADGAGCLPFSIRPFSNPAALSPISITCPTNWGGSDLHMGWANVDTNDSVPFLLTTYRNVNPYPSAWYNEIMAVDPTYGTVWRFAHTYDSAQSQRFEAQQAIGSVSQDGNFFAFTSDIEGTLGSESGSSTCTLGTNCRNDLFIVALNPRP